ncbi:MAG: putative glycoside hydrolase [Planctomycetota bacterium]
MRRYVLFILCLGLSTAAAQGRAAKINPDFPRIANFYGAGVGWKEMNDEEIRKAARYDLIAGGCMDVHYNWDRTWGKEGRRLKDNIPRCEKNIAKIRQINPNFLALPYIVLIEATTEDNPVPDHFWLKDTKGRLIPNWPGCCRVDLTSTKVVDYILWLARDELLSHDCFDGIFYDCFSRKISGTNDGDLDTNRDGKRDDPAELDRLWLENNMRIIRETSRMRGGDALVMINDWVITDYGYEYLNGCLGEDQVVRVTRGELSFDKMMANYLAWFEKGRKPIITSFATTANMGWIDPYVWRALHKEEKERRMAEGQKDERMMRLGLTTTLMGDGYHAFDAGNAGRGRYWWYKEYDAPLGYPKGPCRKHEDGTWRREYDGGLVVCNPGLYDVEVSLNRKMKDVTTDLVVEKFIVPAMDGRIFLPSDAPLSPADAPPKATLPLAAKDLQVVEAAHGRVIRSPGGLDVWLDGDQAVRNMTLHGLPVIRGGSPGISASGWKRFHREGVTTSVENTATSIALTARGTLALEQQKIAFTERIELGADNHVCLTFDAEALTDLDLRMWRHFVGLPVELFAGGLVRGGKMETALPAEITKGTLLKDASECEAISRPGGVRVRIVASSPMHLVDHRPSGQDEYLLCHYPVPRGAVERGRKVSARLDLWFDGGK